MEIFTSPELLIALVTLTFLEIVLGVDNVIFISILSGKLPLSEQKRARRVGLLAAMFMRIGLLFSLNWMASHDSKIDRVALLTFEKYMTCREKLHEIRNSEIKKKMVEHSHRKNAGASASAEEMLSICDEA